MSWQSVSANSEVLYRVLRALAGMGIFSEQGQKRFQLTLLAELLRSDVSGSLRGSALVYGVSWWWQPVGKLFDTVMTGRCAFEDVHGEGLFEYLGKAEDAAGIFNKSHPYWLGAPMATGRTAEPAPPLIRNGRIMVQEVHTFK